MQAATLSPVPQVWPAVHCASFVQLVLSRVRRLREQQQAVRIATGPLPKHFAHVRNSLSTLLITALTSEGFSEDGADMMVGHGSRYRGRWSKGNEDGGVEMTNDERKRVRKMLKQRPSVHTLVCCCCVRRAHSLRWAAVKASCLSTRYACVPDGGGTRRLADLLRQLQSRASDYLSRGYL